MQQKHIINTVYEVCEGLHVFRHDICSTVSYSVEYLWLCLFQNFYKVVTKIP